MHPDTVPLTVSINQVNKNISDLSRNVKPYIIQLPTERCLRAVHSVKQSHKNRRM